MRADLEVRPAVARGAGHQPLLHLRAQGGAPGARVDVQNGGAGAGVGEGEQELAVEATGAAQGCGGRRERERKGDEDEDDCDAIRGVRV